MEKFSDIKYQRAVIDPIPDEFVRMCDGVKNAESEEEAVSSYIAADRYLTHVYTMYQIAYTRFTINTEDEFYKSERDCYDEFLPALQELSASVDRAIVASPYRQAIEKLVGSVAVKNMELSSRCISPEVVGDLTRENALISEYQALTASARIEFDGKVLNLPQLGPYKISLDRETRHAAFKAENDFFKSIGDRLDGIFDELVGVRTSMAKKLGFKTFTELAYCRNTRNCYGPKEVAAFRDEVVRGVVPLVDELKKLQFKRTGVSDPKKWDMDFEFKSGNPKPVGDAKQILDNGVRMYHELSEQTGEFIDFMTGHELFDVLAKPGKANGGYCTEFAELKAPFVFASFNGTQGDVEVLTHECGHAFEGYVASRIYELSAPAQYTMDIAEIHSMSMEFFTYPWMKLFFGGDTDKFFFSHLSGNIEFWPYGCLVDHFQHSVYDNPDMTPAERHAEWARLEKIYCPGIEYGDLDRYGMGAMWQRQLHIYEVPFYYIDYCMAQYAAVCFWRLMREDRAKAWDVYLELIKKAGTRTYSDLLREAGFELPFNEGAVSGLARSAYDYLVSIEDKSERH